MTLKELRVKGREQARGNILMLFVVELVWGTIVSVLLTPVSIAYTIMLLASIDILGNAITNMSLYIWANIVYMILTYAIVILVGGLIMYGVARNSKRMWGGEKATIEAGLSPIVNKKKISLKTYALMFLYIMLWSMIPIVGFVIMIVKSYSYACAFYIMEEDNSVNGNAAITKSRELMNGHKMKMFLLDLSYIGWYFLVFLTFGILAIWVTPWHNQARYILYQQIKSQHLTAQR